MPTRFSFKDIIYRRPRISNTFRGISSVIGIDTETYVTGAPFIICLSDGSSYKPPDLIKALFTRTYRNGHFAAWNLKFDSGSIIHHLPKSIKGELRTGGKVKYQGYQYRYIPHKLLRISKGKNAVSIWDLYPFFKCSLEKAAADYLGKHKMDMETKSFSYRYVKKHYDEIRRYCLRDAQLVSMLYDYLLEGLKEIDIVPSSLYSVASLSFQYFRCNTKIIDVYRFWEKYREILLYACESYAGGKFEVYRRGRFNGVIYDINSAYPTEIAGLYDITDAAVLKSARYQSRAEYGFLRVFITNHRGRNITPSRKWGTLNIYPAGAFHCTITKQEYDYLKEMRVQVKILSAWWLFIDKLRTPYRRHIAKVFRQKDYYKGKDARMYMIYKLIGNSFYGKMVQLTEHEDGTIHAGQGWNPIYGAIITANTRIQLTRMANRLGKHCLAVHTDSVITTKDIPRECIGSDLGQWGKVTEGEGVVVGCGMYQVNTYKKYRGIIVHDDFDWFGILNSMRSRSRLSLSQKLVMSWVEANFRGDDEAANQFLFSAKEINLNADKKRMWTDEINARQLLNTNYESMPHIVVEPLDKKWRLFHDNGNDKR